jgi:hypothetical protein
MHSAMGDQSNEVQRRFASVGVLHCLDESLVVKELARLDRVIYARGVHSNDAAGADVEVAHFAVAHLSRSQAYVLPRSFNECVGKLLVPLIEMRRLSESNSVTFSLGGVTESV